MLNRLKQIDGLTWAGFGIGVVIGLMFWAIFYTYAFADCESWWVKTSSLDSIPARCASYYLTIGK